MSDKRPSSAAGGRASAVTALAVVAYLGGLAVLIHVSLLPPAPQKVTVGANVFSAERALIDLRIIASLPHPMGSLAHTRARTYLVGRLSRLGLKTIVHETTVVRPRRGRVIIAGHVFNVAARLRGTSRSRRAVVLTSHYDSKPTTPGASDGTYGVAALLETARALLAGPRPRHDVIFLFTDGEEMGLLGARAFAREHPWAKDAAVVLDFESRGATGPVVMFRTSDGNGRLVDALAEAVPAPFATSLAGAVYRRMPNATDLDEWLPLGYPALDFANIGSHARYHAPTDTVARIDMRTLQHHGTYALGMARYLANRDLSNLAGPDATYFNPVPRVLVRYPLNWSLPLSLVPVALLILVVVLGIRRSALSLVGIAAGAGLSLVSLILSAGMALVLAWAGGYLAMRTPMVVSSSSLRAALLAGGLLSLAVAAHTALQGVGRRRFGGAEIAVGSLLPWLLLAVLTAVWLPGGSYLFAWPPLLALIAWAVVIALRWPGDGQRARLLTATAVALPVVNLGATAVLLMSAFGLALAPALLGLGALGLGLLVPVLEGLRAWAPRLVPVAAVVLGLGLLLAGWLKSPFDTDHPRPGTLLLAVDHDLKRALWVSPDLTPDSWVKKMLGKGVLRPVPRFFPLEPRRTVLTRETLVGTVPPPRLEVLDRTVAQGERRVKVRLLAPRGTRLMAIAAGANAMITRARLDGRPLPIEPRGGLLVYAFAPPQTGFVLELVARSTGPVSLRLITARGGLPASVPPRPPGLMAKPSMVLPPHDPLADSDSTLVTRAFSL